MMSNLKSFAFQIDTEIDLRYRNVDFTQNRLNIEKTAITLKKIFSDRKGDRFILFTKGEWEEDFHDSSLEQAYLQYKGPMGRWNITSGRFLIPFGLLPNYDTEWLLVKSQEDKTIGMKYDSGIKLSGIRGGFDYAISITQGVGIRRWTDIDDDKVVTLRVGYEGRDFEDLKIGFSSLVGKVLLNDGKAINKKLLAVDLMKQKGPFAGRGELVLGRNSEENLIGAFLGVDYSLFPRVELNLAYAYFHRENFSDVSTIGITYKTPLPGLILRMTYSHSSNGNNKNESAIQIYKRFSYNF